MSDEAPKEPLAYTPLLHAWMQVLGQLKGHGHKAPVGILLDKQSGDQLLFELRSTGRVPDWRDDMPNAFGMNEVWVENTAFRWPSDAPQRRVAG